MNKFSRERVKGFLHTNGRKMVNGEGETVVLRGWGAGNWMNPEGFMIGVCLCLWRMRISMILLFPEGLNGAERWRQQ